MFIGKIDEITHLLLAVWANGLYESQIDEIIDHYGREEVLKAERSLYDTTVFKLITFDL